jgi:hypothetical protein
MAGLGPAALQQLDLERGDLESLSHDESFDYLCPSFGAAGELYYIQRPYERIARTKPHAVLKDILFFPFRLIRAVFAFLNVFSMFFSGKPLKTAGGPARKGPDPKAIYLYGRWVNVQEQLSKAQPEDAISAVPRSWVLKRQSPGSDFASAETIASGVMAYTVADDGTLLYSDGCAVFKLPAGSRSAVKISPRPLVTCLFAAKL